MPVIVKFSPGIPPSPGPPFSPFNPFNPGKPSPPGLPFRPKIQFVEIWHFYQWISTKCGISKCICICLIVTDQTGIIQPVPPESLSQLLYTSTRLSLIKGWFLFNNRNEISYPALQEWNFQPLPFLLSGLGNHLVQVFQQLLLLLHKQTKLMKSQLHMRVISLTSKSVYTLSEKPFILKKTHVELNLCEAG